MLWILLTLMEVNYPSISGNTKDLFRLLIIADIMTLGVVALIIVVKTSTFFGGIVKLITFCLLITLPFGGVPLIAIATVEGIQRKRQGVGFWGKKDIAYHFTGDKKYKKTTSGYWFGCLFAILVNYKWFLHFW